MNSVSLLSRISLAGVAVSLVALSFNVGALVAFASATSALLLLVGVSDYRRPHDHAVRTKAGLNRREAMPLAA